MIAYSNRPLTLMDLVITSDPHKYSDVTVWYEDVSGVLHAMHQARVETLGDGTHILVLREMRPL